MVCNNCGRQAATSEQFCQACGTQFQNQMQQPQMQQQPMNQMQQPQVQENDIKNNMFAYIAFGAGIASIGTDLLAMFVAVGSTMLFISFILEIVAVGTGVIALALKQDKSKATTGILLGGIGLVTSLLFGFAF